jgi:peptide-methionine (S)-S-oxide reductase
MSASPVRVVSAAAVAALVVLAGCGHRAGGSNPEYVDPLSRIDLKGRTMEKATFGAGCFWGVEAAFRQVPGVLRTQVGYAGGTLENPTYQDVCTDRTGHAEVVEVDFDPNEVSYEQLLDVFWRCHNPTQRNRQGPDFGTQYRSAIFYHSEAQRQAAEASKQQLADSGRWDRPIVTQIEPAGTFYRAEEYHQQYLEKRGQTRCHL